MCKMMEEIHQNAVDHGWWEKPRYVKETFALVISEWIEALEEYRSGRSDTEAIVTELADGLIRILDFIGSDNWMTKAIRDGTLAFSWDIVDSMAKDINVSKTFGVFIYDMIAMTYTASSNAICTESKFGWWDKPVAISFISAVRIIFARCAAYANAYEMDIVAAIMEKHKYNVTRPHRHGGKLL